MKYLILFVLLMVCVGCSNELILREGETAAAWSTIKVKPQGSFEKLVSKVKPGGVLTLREGVYPMAEGGTLDLSHVSEIRASEGATVVIHTRLNKACRALTTTGSIRILGIHFDSGVDLKEGHWEFENCEIHHRPWISKIYDGKLHENYHFDKDWEIALQSSKARLKWTGGKIIMDWPALADAKVYEHSLAVYASGTAKFEFDKTHITVKDGNPIFASSGIQARSGGTIRFTDGRIDQFMRCVFAGGVGSKVWLKGSTIASKDAPKINSWSESTIWAYGTAFISLDDCIVENSQIKVSKDSWLEAREVLCRQLDNTGNDSAVVVHKSAKKVLLEQCTLSGWKWAGVRIYPNANVTIRNCKLDSNRFGMIAADPNSLSVEGTSLSNNAKDGFRWSGLEGDVASLTNCTISNNGDKGVVLVSALEHRPAFTDCTRVGNKTPEFTVVPWEQSITNHLIKDLSPRKIEQSLYAKKGRYGRIIAEANHWNILCDIGNSELIYAFNNWWLDGAFDRVENYVGQYTNCSAFASVLLREAWRKPRAASNSEYFTELSDFADTLDKVTGAYPQPESVAKLLKALAWRVRVWEGLDDGLTKRLSQQVDRQWILSHHRGARMYTRDSTLSTAIALSMGAIELEEAVTALSSLSPVKISKPSIPTIPEFLWWVQGSEATPNYALRIAYEKAGIQRNIVSPVVKGDKKDADTVYKAGLALLYGIGVPEDHQKALALITQASETGHEIASGHLAREEMKRANLILLEMAN